MLPVTVSALNELLASYPFTKRLGASVSEIGDGLCVLEVPYNAENDRPGDIVSGQVYMHAADVAFWLSIKTKLGMDDCSVTSSMTTAFLASARREGFCCRATVLRVGGRLIFGVAECESAGRILTHHTLSYARANPGAPR